MTVAQVRTGHSPLAAAYLHRIARRDSAICPHCHSADETVELLVFQCPAHDHARRDTWPGDTFTTDPRRLWNYLERIGAVTRPPRPGMRERESRFDVDCLMCLSCRLLVGHEHEHLRGAGPLRSAVLPGRTDPAARQHAVLLPARTPPGRRRLGPSLRRRRTGDRRQRRVLGTARHPAALERPGRRQNDDHHRPD